MGCISSNNQDKREDYYLYRIVLEKRDVPILINRDNRKDIDHCVSIFDTSFVLKQY